MQIELFTKSELELKLQDLDTAIKVLQSHVDPASIDYETIKGSIETLYTIKLSFMTKLYRMNHNSASHANLAAADYEYIK